MTTQQRQQALDLTQTLHDAPDLDLSAQPDAILLEALALAFQNKDSLVLAHLATDLERRISRHDQVTDRARLLVRSQTELWHHGAYQRLLGAALYAIGHDQIFLASWAVVLQHRPDPETLPALLERIVRGDRPESPPEPGDRGVILSNVLLGRI